MRRRSWTWDFPPFAEMQVAIGDLLQEITDLGACWSDPGFPHTDLQKTEEGYELVAEVPGMGREELHVSVAGQRISLTGERVRAAGPSDEESRSERFFGKFEKTVDLPADADLTGIRARLADGLLKIQVPFRATTEVKIEGE